MANLQQKYNAEDQGPDARPVLLTSVIFAVFLLLAALILIVILPKQASTIAAVALVLYLLVIGPFFGVYLIRRYRQNNMVRETFLTSSSIANVLHTVSDVPYFLLDPSDDGSVKLLNGELRRLIGTRTWTHNFPLRDLCYASARHICASAVCSRADILESFRDDYFQLFPGAASPEDEVKTGFAEPKDSRRNLQKAFFYAGWDQNMSMTIGQRNYLMHATPLKAHNRLYCLVWLDDVTEFVSLWTKNDREFPVLSYIVLDNLEELAQYVGINARAAANKIEVILSDWAAELHGILREYERDKYLLLFPKEYLENCIKSEFDILSRVQKTGVGDETQAVTVSIGMAATGANLQERERDARSALELALQRGGGQVVLRTKAGTLYFGGFTKPIEKSSATDMRVAGIELLRRIRQASNILIMGHRNPDYDAIASSIGMARLCMCANGGRSDNLRIVSDLSSRDLGLCVQQLTSFPEYDHLFISRDEAQEEVRTDTLLIICDVNNIPISEAPFLVDSVRNIAIIDHHTKAAEFKFKPNPEVILPEASSASELVASIFMQCPYTDMLRKEEANLLLAGIMLDTKNFVMSTSWQTLEVVQYLYKCNAHTSVANNLFNQSLNEIVVSGQLEQNARQYRGKYVLTWAQFPRELKPEDRVLAAKASDKLLSTQDALATFAIIQTTTGAVISGRSKGTVSVKLILEKLGGGGHFDQAGAQMRESELGKTASAVKDAIDQYENDVARSSK